MTKTMAANCDKGAANDVTVVFPGQSQTSSGITVLSRIGVNRIEVPDRVAPTLFDV